MVEINNYFSLFISIVIATTIFGSILVWIINWKLVKESIVWKLFDYIWFGAAALGIYSLCGNYDQFIVNRIYKNFYFPEIKYQYKILYESFKEGEKQYCQNYFNQIQFKVLESKNSYVDINLTVPDLTRITLCTYFEETNKKIQAPEAFTESYPQLSTIGIRPYTEICPTCNKLFVSTDQCFYKIEDKILKIMDDYKTIHTKGEELKASTEFPNRYSNFTLLIIFFGVLLGLRLSKITAELKDFCNERKKNIKLILEQEFEEFCRKLEDFKIRHWSLLILYIVAIIFLYLFWGAKINEGLGSS